MVTLGQYLEMAGPELDREIDVIALLLPYEYRRLYQADARFHRSLHLLAEMLPQWVEGMAAAAQRNVDRQEAYYRHAMTDFASPMLTLEDVSSALADLQDHHPSRWPRGRPEGPEGPPEAS